MRFLVDANLPRSLAEHLSAAGHEVEFARDVGLGSATDLAIAAHGQANGAALISRDLDFADVRRYPPEQYAGIVVLRLLDDVTASQIVRLAMRFLGDQRFLSQLGRRLAIVEADRVRFRPPLP